MDLILIIFVCNVKHYGLRKWMLIRLIMEMIIVGILSICYKINLVFVEILIKRLRIFTKTHSFKAQWTQHQKFHKSIQKPPKKFPTHSLSKILKHPHYWLLFKIYLHTHQKSYHKSRFYSKKDRVEKTELQIHNVNIQCNRLHI